MSIVDWFRPRWRHSDPSVRKYAVRSLTKPELILKAAMKEENYAVCEVAVDKLGLDQVAQVAVAARTEAARQAAQNQLLKVAKGGNYYLHVRKTAVAYLSDETRLADIAENAADADSSRILPGQSYFSSEVRDFAAKRLKERMAYRRADV